MARYYPIYLKLEGLRGLVVGGGPVAERKVAGLREAGAQVRVVSLEFTPGLQALAETGEIEVIADRYDALHLDGVALVFAATSDRSVNAQIAADAAARNVPVNVADSPEESGFIVPSVVRRGDLCVSISTGGNSPMLAARLGEEMAARFGPEYAAYVELLGRMRAHIKDATPDAAQRRNALAALLDAEPELLAALRDGGGRKESAEAQATALVACALGGERSR